ncbi:oligosaccharide flippase family protein [Sphingomonas sp. 22L2VL55-3]
MIPLVRSWIAYAALPAAGIITAPILAHALGPEGRGHLAGILQPMTLASAIAAIGVPSAVTYFIGRNFSPRQTTRLGIRISFVTTVLVGLFLIFYSGRVSHQMNVDRISMLLIWTAFLPSALISIWRARLQGFRNYVTLDLERFLGAAFRVLIIIVLWLIGTRSVVVFAAAYMVAGLAASVVLVRPSILIKLPSETEPLQLTAKRFVNYSLLSSFGTIAAAMSARLDQAIMPVVVSSTELGFYSVAVTVSEISSFITTVVARNVLADASAGISAGAITRSVLIGGLAQTALIGGILLFLPEIVLFAFGRDFLPTVSVTRVLLISSFIGYWATIASAYLAGLGRPGFGSLGQAAAAVMTALLFWIEWRNLNATVVGWISVWSQVAALVILVSLTVAIQINRRGNLTT